MLLTPKGPNGKTWEFLEEESTILFYRQNTKKPDTKPGMYTAMIRNSLIALKNILHMDSIPFYLDQIL